MIRIDLPRVPAYESGDSRPVGWSAPDAEEPELLVAARRWADADRRVKEAEGDLAVAQARLRNEEVSRDSAHRDLCAVVQGVSLLAEAHPEAP